MNRKGQGLTLNPSVGFILAIIIFICFLGIIFYVLPQFEELIVGYEEKNSTKEYLVKCENGTIYSGNLTDNIIKADCVIEYIEININETFTVTT